MNPMGLLGLNKLMLIHSGEEIAEILRICANASNYPICYHCSSGLILPPPPLSIFSQNPPSNIFPGKDRTGLISALILSLCGVSKADVVANYHLSETLLEAVIPLIEAENEDKGLVGFDGTPSEVMEQTLDFIDSEWGSVPSYLKSIGFEYFEQQMLVNNMVHYTV